MDILFIYPHIGDGKKRVPGTRRYFPWGVATIMQYLENDGHRTRILDVYANDFLPHEVEERLDRNRPDCVCISGFASYNYGYALWLAEAVKKRYAVPVVIGGVLADLHYSLLLSKKTVDFCVIGEGENTAVDLFRNLDRPVRVKGIAFRENGGVRVNEPRELISDLDTLPIPDFDKWKMEPYLKGSLWADDGSTSYEAYDLKLPSYEQLHPNIAMFFGRGCPFKCRFCSRSYQTVRFKSVDRVIEEIRILKQKLGIKAVHFYDELVVFRRKTVLELCSRIKQEGVFWDCQGRVNTVDRELMRIMKEANCFSIGFGFESGSDRMLSAMNKGTTREQNIRVLRDAKEIGMHLKIQLMCGYPGETRETMDETVSMMKIAGFPPRYINWATPLPGSALFAEAIEKGLVPDEEEFLLKLGRLNMNGPNSIVLNMSGLEDQEMERLFLKAHASMERNFFLSHLASNPFRRIYWYRIYRYLRGRLAKVSWLKRIYAGIRSRMA